MNKNRMANFGLFLFLVCCIAVGATILENVTGALDLYRAQQATRQAEARARQLEAELELTRARADVETAKGERAVLESAARAVDNNTRLVTWYSLRGDLRAILGLVGALGLTVCGLILFVLVQGVNNAKDAQR